VADFNINDVKVLSSQGYLNDTISDSFDNFIVMEFMIENLEMEILAKFTIISIFEYGYNFINSYNVDIVLKSFVSNSYHFRFIFIIVLLILIIYETFVLIREIKELNNSYNSWYIKRKISTSVHSMVARMHLNSEFIRKLKVIFNPTRASMFIILFLLYILILLFIISLSFESKIYSLYNNYSSNLIKLNDDSRSQIAVKTLSKNFMIVILLFLMLPSFIFYSYLVFGLIDKNYNSFLKSVLLNFLKLFDFKNDMSSEINTGMKVLFVISFGFLMNLIILNLFVSIINSSYQKVRSKIFYSSENFSWIKVIFFCCNKKKITSKIVSKEIIQNEIENFVRTHEAEPMVNLTAEFRTYQEFAKFEIEKLKQVDDSLLWIQNRTNLMQISLICNKNTDTNNLNDDRFKSVDENLMNLQYFAGLKYKMELVNSLEKDVLEIKESAYKLSVYLMNQKNSKVRNDENNKDENLIKELLLLEKQYSDLISDIEELRQIKNDIEETNKQKQEEVNSENYFNDNNK